MFDASDECIELKNDGNGFTITANQNKGYTGK